jgi:drug/metabolite transporter (DMT)-like permease
MTSLMLLGGAEALSIWSNNAALAHTTVSINQSIKSLTPLFLLFLAYERMDTHRFDVQLLAIIIIVCGIVGMVQHGRAVTGTNNDTLYGIGLTIVSFVFVIVRFKMQEKLLHDKRFSRWGVLCVQCLTSGFMLLLGHMGFETPVSVSLDESIVIIFSALIAVLYNISVIMMAERFEALQNSIIASLRQALLIMVATFTENDFTVDKVLFGICVGSASLLYNVYNKDVSYKVITGSRYKTIRTVGICILTVVMTFGMGVWWRVPKRWKDVEVSSNVTQWQCAPWDGTAQIELVYARYSEDYDSTIHIVAAAQELRAPLTVYQAVDAPSMQVPSFKIRNMTSFLNSIQCVRLRYKPNIQDESGAYLQYIIDRYDSLPNYVVFMKGSFADFIPRWQGKHPDFVWVDFAQNFIPPSNDSVTYASMPSHYDDCTPLCRTTDAGALMINKVFPETHLRQPNITFMNAQIVTTRKAIRRTSISTYNKFQHISYFPEHIQYHMVNDRHGNTRHMSWFGFAFEWGGFQSLFGGENSSSSDICHFVNANTCTRFLDSFVIKNTAENGDKCGPCADAPRAHSGMTYFF